MNTIDAARTIKAKSKGGALQVPARDKRDQGPRRDSKGNKLGGENVKTVIGSASGLFGLIGAAAAGLFATKKKEEEDDK